LREDSMKMTQWDKDMIAAGRIVGRRMRDEYAIAVECLGDYEHGFRVVAKKLNETAGAWAEWDARDITEAVTIMRAVAEGASLARQQIEAGVRPLNYEDTVVCHACGARAGERSAGLHDGCPVCNPEGWGNCRKCGSFFNLSKQERCQSCEPEEDPAEHIAAGGVRHPEVTVRLVGEDGNAFAILATVKRALRRAGVDETEIARFRDEAVAGDYDHLLNTCMEWVNVT
jgi:hypothetical protein